MKKIFVGLIIIAFFAISCDYKIDVFGNQTPGEEEPEDPWYEYIISTININTGDVQDLVHEKYENPKFSYDGSKIIAYISREIWIFDSDGSNAECVIEDWPSSPKFSISPIDHSIIFVHDSNIYRFEYLINDLINLTINFDKYVVGANISSDGSKIVFNTSHYDHESGITTINLYTMDSDGTNFELLFHSSGPWNENHRILNPIFSDDMTKIFFQGSILETEDGFFMCNPDGSDIETIYDDVRISMPITSISEYVAFTTSPNGIAVCNYYSGSVNTIPFGHYPILSPNGNKLLFSNSNDGSLCISDLDGSNMETLEPMSFGFSHSFSPDGEKILFNRKITHYPS